MLTGNCVLITVELISCFLLLLLIRYLCLINFDMLIYFNFYYIFICTNHDTIPNVLTAKPWVDVLPGPAS